LRTVRGNGTSTYQADNGPSWTQHGSISPLSEEHHSFFTLGLPSRSSSPNLHITRLSPAAIAVLRERERRTHTQTFLRCTRLTRESRPRPSMARRITQSIVTARHTHLPNLFSLKLPGADQRHTPLHKVPPLSDKGPTRALARSGKVSSLDEVQSMRADW
jgi:hypothetical protein